MSKKRKLSAVSESVGPVVTTGLGDLDDHKSPRRQVCNSEVLRMFHEVNDLYDIATQTYQSCIYALSAAFDLGDAACEEFRDNTRTRIEKSCSELSDRCRTIGNEWISDRRGRGLTPLGSSFDGTVQPYVQQASDGLRGLIDLLDETASLGPRGAYGLSRILEFRRALALVEVDLKELYHVTDQISVTEEAAEDLWLCHQRDLVA